MATEKSWYVFTYFGHLMTKQERLPYSHLVGTANAMHGRTDAAFQAEAGERDALICGSDFLATQRCCV